MLASGTSEAYAEHMSLPLVTSTWIDDSKAAPSLHSSTCPPSHDANAGCHDSNAAMSTTALSFGAWRDRTNLYASLALPFQCDTADTATTASSHTANPTHTIRLPAASLIAQEEMILTVRVPGC